MEIIIDIPLAEHYAFMIIIQMYYSSSYMFCDRTPSCWVLRNKKHSPHSADLPYQ